VHRTYAVALFEAARENGRLAQVREQLADFVQSVDEVPELHALLRNPQLEPRQKAAILGELIGDADELVRNFLRLLAEKGRIGEIDEIGREFERLSAEEEGVLNLELTTAVELSDQDAKAIVEQIEKSSGRRVEARRSVDPGLVGGIVVQIGSMRLDASVRGRLERLRRELVRRS
jgi:F-type H+-transporting ATPase subunit delta